MKLIHDPRWILKPLLLSLSLSILTMNFARAYIRTPEAACTEIDFRKSFPMKTRDQGDLSWCFAHAAADYLQYTYQLPEQISAADIAINYFQTGTSQLITFFQKLFSRSARKGPPETGFIRRAIDKTLPHGYCAESVLPSENWPTIDSATGARKETPLLDVITGLYSIQKKVQKRRIRSAAALPWHVDLRNLSREDLFHLLKKSSKKNLLLNIRKQVCGDVRKPFPHVPISYQFVIRGKHAFKRINASFDRQMPVAVDFFSGVFDRYHGFKKRIGDLHTTLLYGRKYDSASQQCVYLMKNSYGESCEGYAPELKCESGYLWFPEMKLHEALTSETFIQRL